MSKINDLSVFSVAYNPTINEKVFVKLKEAYRPSMIDNDGQMGQYDTIVVTSMYGYLEIPIDPVLQTILDNDIDYIEI